VASATGVTVSIPHAEASNRRAFSGAAAFFRNRSAVIGLVVILGLVVIALTADVISPETQGSMNYAPTMPPSAEHPMGTDNLGRDVFYRWVHGARISMAIGTFAAGTSIVIGVVIGLCAGYRGGFSDDGLMRFTEAVQTTPRFFLALVVVVLFGSSVVHIALIIGLLSWPGISRLIRAESLSIREHEYIHAARSLGARDRRIMFRHVFPNAVQPAIVAGSLLVSQAILIESSLSFLGLGDPSTPSWGLMLNQAQAFLASGWWLAAFPGLGILLASLGFNLLGDGLNDVLNP
jgi:peptide/nickel transport system permease protein